MGVLSDCPEPLEVAVRAYATPLRSRPGNAPASRRIPELPPSRWSIVWDTETTVDAAQRFRLGIAQLREGDDLKLQLAFADVETLDQSDRAVLERFARERRLELWSVDQFIALLYRVVIDWGGTCIGFNLPFDLSRIAKHHGSAPGRMRGGFSFQLLGDPKGRRIQVKHLNARAALIQLTKRNQQTARSLRRRGDRVEQRGHFVDVKTLAGALLGSGFSLKRLGDHLQTEHRKLDADEYGGPLTAEFLTYAWTDVQVTWECFAKLRDQYAGYALPTPLSRLYSAASIGKALLREMCVTPLRDRRLGFAPELTGRILASYFGGRAEVHERRVVRQVLYLDVHSMYPSVCVLQGLWDLVIAERIEEYDATEEVRGLLAQVTPEQLQTPETWRRLHAIVEVVPEGDVFPVRARYADGAFTIGVQRVTDTRSYWWTLADCVASVLQTGHQPKVLRAIGFRPVGKQRGLKPIDLLGNPRYRFDPNTEDLYRRLIDLRDEIKDAERQALAVGDAATAALRHAEQKALKDLVNSTAYGIFVELVVRRYARLQRVRVYGAGDEPFTARVHNVEEPGAFFEPLLGTLITGAGRLLLMLAELRAEGEGTGWMFCDTDSMPLSRPDGMSVGDFVARAKRVQAWFDPLNPYTKPQPLFKIEDQNFGLDANGRLTDQLAPLYGFAVSAKRNVLFNRGPDGRPILRKVSAHGLGHLIAPYDADHAPTSVPPPIVSLASLEAERWQHDLWYQIVEAALGDRPELVDLSGLPGLEKPAATRYAATTPELLGWFRAFNEGRPYENQVRPFGFLIAFQARATPELEGDELPRIVAPYDKELAKAASRAFDRRTGRPVRPSELKTYREAIAQYHLHPEAKFAGGDYTDRGVTRRRHVTAAIATNIGKEANEWERQLHLGTDEATAIVYGAQPAELEGARRRVTIEVRRHGVRGLARSAGVSPAEISALVHGRRRPRDATIARLLRASPRMR